MRFIFAMGIGCLFGFFYFKKDSAYTGHVEIGFNEWYYGVHLSIFIFLLKSWKNYKIKKKHDVLHENFIMYEKNQNKGYANDFLCFLFRFYSYS